MKAADHSDDFEGSDGGPLPAPAAAPKPDTNSNIVTDVEVEAAAEALARYGMDEATLASAGGKPLLSLMSAENRAGYLAKVRAGLEAAAAAGAAAKKISPPPESAHPPSRAPFLKHADYKLLARIAQRLGARGSEEEIAAAFVGEGAPALGRDDGGRGRFW